MQSSQRTVLFKNRDAWGQLATKISTLPCDGLKNFLLKLFEGMKTMDCFEPATGPGKGRNAHKFYVEFLEHGVAFTVASPENGNVSIELLQFFLPRMKSLRLLLKLGVDDADKFPYHVLPNQDDEVRFFKIAKDGAKFSFILVTFRTTLYYDTSNTKYCFDAFQQDQNEIDFGCFIYAIGLKSDYCVYMLPNRFISEFESFQNWKKVLLPSTEIQLNHTESNVDLTFVKCSERFDLLKSSYDAI